MTLIETLIYIALLGILMTSLVLSAFTFIEHNRVLELEAFKVQNAALLNFNDYE